MVGPLVINQRKDWATVGPYGPDTLGYTRPTMVRTMCCNAERRSQSSNLTSVQIVGCKDTSRNFNFESKLWYICHLFTTKLWKVKG